MTSRLLRRWLSDRFLFAVPGLVELLTSRWRSEASRAGCKITEVETSREGGWRERGESQKFSFLGHFHTMSSTLTPSGTKDTVLHTVCTNSSLQSLRGQRSSLSALRGKMNKGIKAFCHRWIFHNTCDNWWDLSNTYLFVRVRVQKIPIMKHTSYTLCKPCWLRGTSTVQRLQLVKVKLSSVGTPVIKAATPLTPSLIKIQKPARDERFQRIQTGEL